MPDSPSTPIAIVGLSGRFPGAHDADALWDMIAAGAEGVAEAPADRPWMRELYDAAPRVPGKVPTTRGGFLPGLGFFDAEFFGMSPREARRADPQLRLLLELAVESAEDAGLPMRSLAGPRTGVFMSGLYSDYWLRQIGDLEALDLYAEVGNAGGVLAGRLSYAFGLRGPSVLVDAACASSLAAVHLACGSLRAGECDVALVGGAQVTLSPFNTVTFASAGALSPEGRCRFGDAAANGYVRSEAAGIVVLKPLDKAIADGDRVRAVILGSAFNNDGFSGAGMAAPNAAAKVEVMRAAFACARIDPKDLHFVEAHGSGTVAGDAAELRALAEVMEGRAAAEPCVVGSVKTCVGHTEGAAGVVGLIKTVLSLEHRTVPRLPFLGELTAELDWGKVPLTLPRGEIELPREGQLLAGVNSFGASGANVHVVLRSAPGPTVGARRTKAREGGSLLLLSARSPEALRALATEYAELLRSSGAPPLHELCAAAVTRRDHHECRLALTARSAYAMADALDDFLAGRERPGTAAAVDGVPPRPRIVFVFPGQGAQWAGMGRELLALGGPFKDTIEACDAVIREHAGFSLLDALAGDDEEWLEQTAKVQPALWAMGTALAAQWRAWGVVPDAVLGHSQGEIPAAHEAGALSLEEAGRVSCLRARLIAEHAAPGAMCWVKLSQEEIPALLDTLGARASVAVEESPESAVLGGVAEQIERIVAGCEERGIDCFTVRAAYAAHSPSVDPVRRPLIEGLAGLQPREGTVPFLSTVTGDHIPGTDLDAAYWWRNLREPVRLNSTLRGLLGPDPVIFLQMSPHPVLTGPLRATGSPALASLRRHRPELASLHESLAALYAAGCELDWDAVLGRPEGHVELPRYPWQRQYHWQQAESFPWPPLSDTDFAPLPSRRAVKPARPEVSTPMHEAPHPLLGDRQGEQGIWQKTLAEETCAFLLDHRVAGRPVLPGAAHVELGLAAARRIGTGAEVRDVALHQMLLLDEDGLDAQELRITVADGGRLSVAGRDRGAGAWSELASMTVATDKVATGGRTVSLEEIQDRCPGWRPGLLFYREREQYGNVWQGAFRGIAELWGGDGEVLARLRPVRAEGFHFHPAAFDCALQLSATVMPLGGERGFVLVGMDRVRLYRDTVEGELWAHARTAGPATVDITVLDASGEVVAEICGVRAKELTAQPDGQPTPPTSKELAWRWRPVLAGPTPQNPGHWVILGSGGSLDKTLARALRTAGCTVTTAGAAQGDPARILKEAAHEGMLQGVVSTVALDCAVDGAASTREVQWTATDLCETLLAQGLALQELQLPSAPRLFALTQEAQAVSEGDACTAPWQAALWGLGQTLAREVPACSAILVDLDGDPDTDVVAALLLAPGPEDRLAVRGSHVFAPRLTAEPGEQPAPGPYPEQGLALHTEGGFTGLRLIPFERPAPGPGQVEIAVSHAALNYHDVLEIPPPDAPEGRTEMHLGIECVGTVTRVGPGVASPVAGTRVMAVAHPAMRTHALADVRHVLPLPRRLAPAEAASLPTVYGTAHYALDLLARLQPGEKVLIHNGTGGFGLAALDLALNRGATVYATASTEEKRQLLLQLGATAVANSRGTAFADDFRSVGGMDVILSPLVGDAVEANFSILAPFGRYVELARSDARKGRPLSMAHFAPGRSYLFLDFRALVFARPEVFTEVMNDVLGMFERDELAVPRVQVFPAEQAADAFGLMVRAGHIGKLVLSFKPQDDSAPGPDKEPTGMSTAFRLRSDATYLVTGGLSGVGGLVSEWLAGQGAGHLLLTGRGDPDADPERAALLNRLRSNGTNVAYERIDAGDERAMARLLRDRAARGIPPVAGVVHSAAVLEPAPLPELSADELADTLHPKVAGGWTLHRLFADQELDFFIVFSSAVSLLSGLRLGSQLGAYAAGNSFLDSLVDYRRALGLPATGVNWGYWAETGLAHRLSLRSGHDVRPEGMLPILPEDAPDLFARMLRTQGRMLVVPADWQAYTEANPQDADAPVLRELLQRADELAEPGGLGSAPQRVPALRASTEALAIHAPRDDAGQMNRAALDISDVAAPLPAPKRNDPAAVPEARRPRSPGAADSAGGTTAATVKAPMSETDSSTLEEWLVEWVARLLDLPVARIDRNRPLNRLGVDSLMAAELDTLLRREHGHQVTIPRLLKAPGIHALAMELATARAAGAA